ncbi:MULTISPECIES: APC family permease [Streptacidiphilus]|uniref:APC family permease n=1 Tax=Streptacidiphilus cavernicola TaxID=3342716 RepID=A0ABV6UXX6_9ACTN|nr:APC family permease [Streptacidiphilus jeojiense]
MPENRPARHPSAAPSGSLAKDALSALETFGQSLAATGPSIAIGGTIPAVYLTAGSGALWSVLIGTAIALLVAYVVAQFARRAVGAGSLYSYVALGLGRGPAFATGWGIVVGYVGIAAACLVGAAVYLGALLGSAGIAATGTAAQLALLVAVTVPAAVLPVRGVRLSARVGILLEAVSLAVILIALIATVTHYGLHFDTDQLTARGASLNSIMLGAVLAVAIFVGFESAGSLGAEARNPHRSIPRAILGTVLGAGVLYLISTYIQVLGFDATAKLASSAAPLNELTRAAGVGWLSPVLNLGIVVSAVACGSASINAAARSVYSLSREGVLPAFLGRVHPRHRTPHTGIYLLAAVSGALPIGLIAAGGAELSVYAWTAAFGTFGYLLAYLLAALALPRYLHRRGLLTPGPTLAAALAVPVILYVTYKNLVPVPAWPVNLLPYVFAGVVLAGLAGYGLLHRRDPARARQLGSLVEDTAATTTAAATEEVPAR